MCIDCVKQEYPDRGTVCIENGCYMPNFAGCAQCKTCNTIRVDDKITQEEDGDEVITFKHVCSNCQHEIAEHQHMFRVEGQFQIYEMTCLLCGNGEDERSIMPYDPRGSNLQIF